ncbi:hypothetical protein RPMA_05740 [Tardiphaga alba]|uniref:Uncharacterized protein n=2 Tax=Tardiphaga alba TaxID=340268 RepID=A0ABX8A4S2_9BRAD|nr:hypothetical protein RPMA_05740 [Tardiphaga alba]
MSSSTITSMQSFALLGKLQPNKTPSALDSAIDTPQTPEEKFLDYAKKSPAEKLRDSLLQSIGVTEEELAQMSPDQRKAIEEKIAEKIKETLEQKASKGESASGFFTDITA